MRKIAVLGLSLAMTCGFAAPAALAQLNIEVSNVDPLTKLTPEKWAQLATRIVNPATVVGKDAVFMVNATGEPLHAVMCGKYQLVGSSPYVTKDETLSAPAELPAWEVTAVPTKGFNTYCKTGVDAVGRTGTYHGTLNGADHSFQNSTFVVFQKAN